MSGYHLAAGVLVALLGVALLARPRGVWRSSHGWHVADPGAVRLSAGYSAWLRVSGAVGLALGAGLILDALR